MREARWGVRVAATLVVLAAEPARADGPAAPGGSPQGTAEEGSLTDIKEHRILREHPRQVG
jgi:hypothetical protein